MPQLLIAQVTEADLETINDSTQVIANDSLVAEKKDSVIVVPELKVKLKPKMMQMPYFMGEMASGSKEVSHSLSIEYTAPNEIIDEETWFEKNKLQLPNYEVPNKYRGIKGNLPPGTPTEYKGNMLIQAIHSDEYNMLIYGEDFSSGRFLLITNNEMTECLYLFDFANYMMSPVYMEQERMFVVQSLLWAQIVNDTLYVSHSHKTYSNSSNGMNAYITAIDLKTSEVIWRSKPLVCNTSNFILYDDMIVSGYGFSKEKDYIYTLNKRTGVIAQKISVKAGPYYIVPKDGKFHIRTYNTDYIFKID